MTRFIWFCSAIFFVLSGDVSYAAYDPDDSTTNATNAQRPNTSTTTPSNGQQACNTAALEADVASLKARVESLETKVTSLESELRTKVTELETKVTTLQQQRPNTTTQQSTQGALSAISTTLTQKIKNNIPIH